SNRARFHESVVPDSVAPASACAWLLSARRPARLTAWRLRPPRRLVLGPLRRSSGLAPPARVFDRPTAPVVRPTNFPDRTISVDALIEQQPHSLPQHGQPDLRAATEALKQAPPEKR